MIALKGMKLQTDCQKCPFMATDGIDKLSPMMCIALWATKHEVKHCTQEKILDDCPLVEIVTCKDCKHYKHHGVNGYCSKRVNTDSHTDVYRESDYFCAVAERKE